MELSYVWKDTVYQKKIMELLCIILLFSVCILFVNVHLFWSIKNIVKVHDGYSEAINAVNEVIWNNFSLLISWKKSTKRKIM